MAGERTHPALPCPDIDDAVAFYEAMGFTPTFRQRRPNPYAVVQREDIHVHLFGLEGFDPATSLGNVIVTVPDPDALHASFADGFRARFGKVLVAGAPRLLRPRKKHGTVRGFSLVDTGGNWLRFSKIGDTEEDDAPKRSGLGRQIDVAARLGDAKGDETLALRTLDAALARYSDADADVRAEALAYREELLERLRS